MVSGQSSVFKQDKCDAQWEEVFSRSLQTINEIKSDKYELGHTSEISSRAIVIVGHRNQQITGIRVVN